MNAVVNLSRHPGLRLAQQVLLLAFAGVLTVVTTTLVMQAGQILPGTTIDGLDVSGLTRQEATAQLSTVAGRRSQPVATVTFMDVSHRLSSDDANVQVDVAATVNTAYARGRAGFFSFVTRPYLLFQTTTVPLTFTFDRAVVAAFVETVAAAHDQPLIDGSLAIQTSRPSVQLVTPQVGVQVARQELEALTVALITQARDSPQPVPAIRERPRLSIAHTTQLAAALKTVLATPQTVAIESSLVTFEPAELASLITLVEETGSDGSVVLRVVIDPARLPNRLIQMAGSHARNPEPARYSSPRRPSRFVTSLGNLTVEPLPYSIQVVPPIDGLIVDAHDLAQQLATAISNGQPHLRLSLRRLSPPEPLTSFEELRPTHLLATFTSPLVAGQARNINIALLAETLDERVILPGESFSINAISGRRRCEDGYVPAGVIVGGELVEACGGGVSQVGTTFLNAAWFAGVQLDAFTPHSFYIGRYSPGREATLSYPQLDVAFTNTTAAALHIRTFTTPTSLTVSLYGQPVFARVQAVHGPRVDPRPFTEERRLDESLPRGTERVLQSGGSGFTITVSRILTTEDGRQRSEQFTTRYLPQRRIVAYNPDAAPANPPPDDETDDEADDAADASKNGPENESDEAALERSGAEFVLSASPAQHRPVAKAQTCKRFARST